MHQSLSLFVIIAVFGMTFASNNERTAVEHALADTLTGDGDNPNDYKKEAHLLNAHLNDHEVHALVEKYGEMDAEKQEAFKEKLVEGGKLFVASEQKSHAPKTAAIKEWLKHAVQDAGQDDTTNSESV